MDIRILLHESEDAPGASGLSAGTSPSYPVVAPRASEEDLDAMDVDVASASASASAAVFGYDGVVRLSGLELVSPGRQITDDAQFMKGHGAYMVPEHRVIACVQGVVDRVNKLVSVRPLRARYTGAIGDVVVGRVSEVAQKRWKVDIASRQDAVLQLSSINLPGGIQRRKSESDELAMRTYFVEGDLLVAEVQMFYHGDHTIGLHTRSTRYGKLRDGCLVTVPSTLVQRCKSHFCALPCGVDIVLGVNGWIWVCVPAATGAASSDAVENLYAGYMKPAVAGAEAVAAAAATAPATNITLVQREAISRVANCINALARHEMPISDATISYAYDASLEYQVAELLRMQVSREVAACAITALRAAMQA